MSEVSGVISQEGEHLVDAGLLVGRSLTEIAGSNPGRSMRRSAPTWLVRLAANPCRDAAEIWLETMCGT